MWALWPQYGPWPSAHRLDTVRCMLCPGVRLGLLSWGLSDALLRTGYEGRMQVRARQATAMILGGWTLVAVVGWWEPAIFGIYVKVEPTGQFQMYLFTACLLCWFKSHWRSLGLLCSVCLHNPESPGTWESTESHWVSEWALFTCYSLCNLLSWNSLGYSASANVTFYQE